MQKFSSYVEHHNGAIGLVGLTGTIVYSIVAHFFGNPRDWVLWVVLVLTVPMMLAGLVGLFPRKRPKESPPPLEKLTPSPVPYGGPMTAVHLGGEGSEAHFNEVDFIGIQAVNASGKNTIVTMTDSTAIDPSRIRPNDKCPCGSGRKFKKCHGRNR